MRKGFKLGIVVILLVVAFFTGHAQQVTLKPKRIYITLDVSRSMKGNKYVMADYVAQSMSVFRNPEDQLSVYYLGRKHNISSEQDLQIKYDKHKGTDTYYEISDLKQFVNDYKPDPNYQDWLFIIGDGDWEWGKARATYEETVGRLTDLFAKEQLQVCYLQTGNDETKEWPFTTFLQGLSSPLIDIRKSDTTAVSVLNNCRYFANKILGFSNTGIRWQQEDPSCATFISEFPLERCLVVYQSEQASANAVQVTSVDCKGQTISYRIKGNPTTQKLVDPGKPILNCVVWELTCPRTIPANETVKVHFNQPVDVKNLTVYPYVDVALHMRPWSQKLDTLQEADQDLFRICDQEDHALVKISATDKEGHKFPPPLMQRMDVKFNVGGKEVPASYSASDTTFLAVLEMPLDTLSYFSMVESPGYFSRISSSQTVVKTPGVCPPEPVSMITLPRQLFMPIGFDALKKGIRFGGAVDDAVFRDIASVGTFEEQTVADQSEYRYISQVSFSCDADGQLLFTQKPNSDWCECAFPDTLKYQVTLRSPKGILFDGKLYEGFVVPVSVPVDKRGWWTRCHLFVMVGAVLFLFFLYLISLLRKKRFKVNASFTPTYYDHYGRRVELGGQRLRKSGLLAWFNRWFIPGREHRTLSFGPPDVPGLYAVAADSNAAVNIKKSSINPETMRIRGYNPNNDTDRSLYVRLSDNERINVIKTSGKDDGYLTFTQGEKSDGAGFRFFIVLLMLATIAAEALIVLTLLKSQGLFL